MIKALYALLRVMRLSRAIARGQTGVYVKRSVKSTLVAKATGGWRTR